MSSRLTPSVGATDAGVREDIAANAPFARDPFENRHAAAERSIAEKKKEGIEPGPLVEMD